MRKELHKILVTGGAGFIGSAFVRLLAKKKIKVVVCDKLSYAGDISRLGSCWSRISFYRLDICSKNAIGRMLYKERPDIIVNFAAQTHVDRSIKKPDEFVRTNIWGAYNLFSLAKELGVKKFIHISTDEVYGEIKRGSFKETAPLSPNNPYSSSKAAADLILKSFIHTYGFPGIIVRPCNTYGPWQYPEKIIPLAIVRLVKGKTIPIYGNGENVREWIYLDDCVEAIWRIVSKGISGEIYNLGSGEELKNLDLAKLILKAMRKKLSQYTFVPDRPGHDYRYSLDSSKMRNYFAWRPKIKIQEGIKKTVAWYLRNKSWILSKSKHLDYF